MYRKIWDFQTGQMFSQGMALLDEPMPWELNKEHTIPLSCSTWAVTITFKEQLQSAKRDNKMRNGFRKHFSAFQDFYAILWSEWSPAPNFKLHYHGMVFGTVQQMVRFRELCNDSFGWTLVKECFNLQDWLKYCTKSEDPDQHKYQTGFKPIVLCNLKRKSQKKKTT